MARKRTIIHMVRHGEVYNPSHVRYGRLPGFHLSDDGRQQVEQTSLFFLSRPITHIYSSPLERTQQTATILGITLSHSPISLDARVIEVKTAAKFEGKSRDIHFYYENNPSPDAESMRDIRNRMYHFMEEKIVQHTGQELVVVSHGDPMAILFHSLVYNEQTTNWRIYPSFASVFSYVFDGLRLESAWYQSAEKEHEWLEGVP